MSKEEKINEELNQEEDIISENASDVEVSDGATIAKDEYTELEAKLKEQTQKCEEYFNLIQRNAAEFDNYKKRTAKEKEALYTDAFADAVEAFLPVVDNMERALAAITGEGSDVKTLKEGVDMVYKQLKDVFSKLKVEEIEAEGQTFDPQLHNAVMHIDDENYGENQIVEVFQKGYKIKDKILRHSMVKVAN